MGGVCHTTRGMAALGLCISMQPFQACSRAAEHVTYGPAAEFYFHGLPRARCAQLIRCADTLGPLFDSLEGCLRYRSQIAAADANQDVDGVAAAISAASVLDPAAADACLAELASSCTSTPLVCDRAIQPIHAIPLGGDCTTQVGTLVPPITATACAAGTVCTEFEAAVGCRACHAPLPNGVTCTRHADCESHHCTWTDVTCTALACAPPDVPGLTRGAACQDLECRNYLKCRESVCVDRFVREGQPCDAYSCALDLVCGSLQVCERPCHGACQHPCVDGYCTAPRDLPVEGACAQQRELPGVCAPGVVPRYRDGNCTCWRPKDAGEACNDDSDCRLPNHPEHANFCIDRVCVIGAANGRPCNSNDICLSQYCSPLTARCETPPETCGT